MTSIRGSISQDPWWRDMYERYSQRTNPDNRGYQRGGYSGIESPLVVDGNAYYTVTLSRHDKGICPYRVSRTGNVDPNAPVLNTRELQQCCDYTGAPYQCATASTPVHMSGGWNRGKYDRMG